jgi:hypothetical protein
MRPLADIPFPRLRGKVGMGGRPGTGARRFGPPTQPPPQAGEGLPRISS